MSNDAQLNEIMDSIKKAVSSSSVDGLSLVREDLSSTMAIQADLRTPLRNRLRRIKGEGKAHSFYRLEGTSSTETQTSGLKFVGGTAPEKMFFDKGGLPDAKQPSYKQIAVPYVSIGDLANVSFFDFYSTKSFNGDLKADQIKTKMLNVAQGEEWGLLYADSSTDAKQFDGLKKQITTNVTDLADAAFTLTDLTTAEQNIVTQGGTPTCIVFGYRDAVRFNELILGSFYRLSQQNGSSMSDIQAGVRINKWSSVHGDVDILKSRFIQEGAASTYYTDIFVLDDMSSSDDGNAIQLVDLLPMSAFDLGLLQSAYRTLICEFTALQITCEAFQAVIKQVGRPA